MSAIIIPTCCGIPFAYLWTDSSSEKNRESNKNELINNSKAMNRNTKNRRLRIMTPVRRNQNWLPSFFNDFFDNDWMLKANATAPAINVIENDKNYKVEVAAPGMTKDDFTVKLDEYNNLVITMERKNENKDENKTNGRYLRREFSYSKFQQTMILPDDVEKDKIAASVEHGVLTINLPKMTQEEVKKAERHIAIQ